jgi:hypothetical protein
MVNHIVHFRQLLPSDTNAIEALHVSLVCSSLQPCHQKLLYCKASARRHTMAQMVAASVLTLQRCGPRTHFRKKWNS